MKVHHNTIASEFNKYINAAIQITLFIYCPNSHIKTLLTSWASLDYIIAKNNLISFSLIDINQNIISNFSLFLWSLFVHIFFSSIHWSLVTTICLYGVFYVIIHKIENPDIGFTLSNTNNSACPALFRERNLTAICHC